MAVYSQQEETANFLTHAAGTLLSIAALSILVTLAGIEGDVWRIVSFSIYGATLVILYLISTLYHAFRSERLKAVFRVLDHISIFLLIAGTYTPFTLVNLRGPWGWSIFGVIWGLAIAGIVFKLFMTGRWQVFSSLVYIMMGWVVLIAFKPLFASVDLSGVLWLIAGGMAYTLGVIFYSMKTIPYHHAIWHCFVLLGSTCHFFAIYFHVLPMP
ncbi:MAG: hemolysin III family protein [bacterium]|jgi:hemolysin III|nr:hemolysin III family protein [bacterium]